MFHITYWELNYDSSYTNDNKNSNSVIRQLNVVFVLNQYSQNFDWLLVDANKREIGVLMKQKRKNLYVWIVEEIDVEPWKLFAGKKWRNKASVHTKKRKEER